MAFTAMLSELYGAFRRKVGADEPTKAAAEAVVIEDTRFRSIDGRFDGLSHTMDQRFEALSQRFDVLSQPFDELSRAMDKRFDALNRALDQRSDVLSRAMDQRFGEFGTPNAFDDKSTFRRDRSTVRRDRCPACALGDESRRDGCPACAFGDENSNRISSSAMGFGHRDRALVRLGDESDS